MGKKKAAGLDDERFSKIKSDPIFSGLKGTDRKVVIDKRFAAALTDERFSSRTKVDMRGRKQKKTLGNNMLDLYELEEDADVAVEKKTKAKKSEKQKKLDDFFDEDKEEDEEADDEQESGGSDEEEEEEEQEQESEIKGGFKKLDLARGEGNVDSSSDDDSDDTDEEEEEDEGDWQKSMEAMQTEVDLAQLDKDADDVEWTSNRLAVCNLEWDHINCEDILMLVKSFTTEEGAVKSVGIYTSDFGKEHLELEEKNGPPVKLSKPIEEYEDGEMDTETKTAVRQYLMNRLKYYYAVITFTTVENAVAVYEECDGFQFEETGLKMDLRFIPDDMEFEEDRVREFLKADDVNIKKYKPKKKPKNSISSTSTKISWDEEDPTRSKKLLQAFDGNETAGRDLIVDSDGSDDEEKRNALMSLLNTDESGERLDIEWSGDEDEKPKKQVGDEEDSDSDGEYVKIDDDQDEIGIGAAKKKTSDDEEEKPEEKLTGYKAFKQKQKSKLAEKKMGKKRGANSVETTNIKTAEAAEQVAQDDRFKALFTDSAFAIEPSSKKFKGSLLVSKQAEQKKKNVESDASSSKQTAPEDLVSKLKLKAAKMAKNKKK